MAIIKVKTGGITADAITDALIADDVVGTEHLTANEVDTTALGADAVTGAQLADDAVNSEHYTDGSVDTAHIADANVTTAKIAADAITAAKIADDAISEEHLDVTAITGHTAETSIADGDTLLIHDASASALRKMTKENFVSGIGGSDAIVYAQTNTATSCADETDTKITLDNELIDTAGLFADSRFTVTSGYAGKYLIIFQLSFNYTAVRFKINPTIKVSNTTVAYGQDFTSKNSNHTMVVGVSIIKDLSANDYVEFFGRQDSGGNKSNNTGIYTNASITKL